MFADYHVHTEFSDDSTYPMEQVVRDAIAMKMDEICFTDHVDYGIKDDWDSGKPIKYRGKEPFANVDYPAYAAKIRELQYLYELQINIKMGMEFGIQTHTIPQYEALFQKYPFDFIILSIHQAEDKEFWTQDFQKGKSQEEYNRRYDENGSFPFEKVEPVISEILRIVIRNGKGIELNTSYHRYGLNDTTPSVNIWKRYRELGGDMITIGNDSHSPGQLGAYIKDAGQLLKTLGFRYFCTFNKMQPVYHKL